jgi:K+-transporting ATPase KdpF subunit
LWSHFSRRFCFTRAVAKNFDFMENLILGIVSVALCVYLIMAMLRPEKF